MNDLQRNRAEFIAAAAQAGRDAVAQSRALGLPITYLRDGEIVTEYPADDTGGNEAMMRRSTKSPPG